MSLARGMKNGEFAKIAIFEVDQKIHWKTADIRTFFSGEMNFTKVFVRPERVTIKKYANYLYQEINNPVEYWFTYPRYGLGGSISTSKIPCVVHTDVQYKVLGEELARYGIKMEGDYKRLSWAQAKELRNMAR